MAPLPVVLAPGTRIAAYDILGAIGAGGMGEVYRARDTELGRDVAIKVLPGNLGSDAAAHTRFDREARAIAALNHPHIVTIHEIAQSEGLDFIVMEFVWPVAQAAHSCKRTASGASDRIRAPDRDRPRGRARRGHRPSGHQTGQHHGDRRGPGEDARLRAGEARVRCDTGGDDRDGAARHAGGRSDGNDRLHVARAGAGADCRRPVGRLLVRRGAVRDVRRPPRVSGRHRCRHAVERAHAGPAADRIDPPGDSGRRLDG